MLAWCLPAQGQDVPTLTGRVVDNADILSPSTEETITTLLTVHEEATSNQIAVLTVPSLGGETIEGYSIRVAETWGLGTAENDNGVLLLVAVTDREMRIEVGLGLEGVLTDAAASRIIRNEMVPRFRSGDFDGGVLVGVERIVGVIEGTYVPLEEPAPEQAPFWVGLIFFLIPTIFAVIALFIPGCFRWFLYVFLMPFYWASGFALTNSEVGGFVVLGVYAVAFIAAGYIPKIKAVHDRYAKQGISTFSMGGSGGSSSSSWSSSSSSSWSSSSSSSWSSSSSSSFSGGGGSFGGGGSSGSW